MTSKRRRNQQESSDSEDQGPSWGELPSTKDFREHRKAYPPEGWSKLLAATKSWLVVRPESGELESDDHVEQRAHNVRRIDLALKNSLPNDPGLSNFEASILFHLPAPVLQGLADRAATTASVEDLRDARLRLKETRLLCNWFFLQGTEEATANAVDDHDHADGGLHFAALSASPSAPPPAPAGAAATAAAAASNVDASSAGPAQIPTTPSKQRSTKTSLPATPSTSAARNRRQRDDCSTRDGGKCVVIKDEDPDVCHIVPFKWNNKEDNRRWTVKHLRALRPFLSAEDYDSIVAHLTSTPRCSDKRWNLISLSQKVHRRWGKAHWAFRVVDEEPDRLKDKHTVVKLQFTWMRWPAGSTPDEQENTFPDDISTWAATGRAPVLAHAEHNFHHDRLHRLTMTGDIVRVSMPDEEAPLFVQMMRLQWLIIRIAAMAGAAGHPEYLFRDDDDDADDAAAARRADVLADADRFAASPSQGRDAGGKTARLGRRVASGARAFGHAMRTASGRILSGSGPMDLAARSKPPVAPAAQETPARRPIPQMPDFLKVSKQGKADSGAKAKTSAPEASLVQHYGTRTDQDQGTRADARAISN